MALFKGENRHESMSMVIGSVLLVVGLVVLFIGFAFAFTIVSDPGGYIKSQIPDLETQTQKGPRAEFRFTITDLTVSVQDATQAGDAGIVSWSWDWGDGGSANGNTPPAHTYTGTFNGVIRLTVRDGNDKESSALGNVDVFTGASSSGNSMPDVGDIGSSINFESVLAPLMGLPYGIIAILLVFAMLFIIWLVGASILKAGWNMIRPRPETIKVRIKPKDLEVEPVYPTTYASPPPAPMQEPPQTPPPYVPPESPPPQQYMEPPPPLPAPD